jgi:hypothetical protein
VREIALSLLYSMPLQVLHVWAPTLKPKP